VKKIKGKPVSPGIVVGKALLFNSHKEIVIREKIDKCAVDGELKRFNQAVKRSRAQLRKIYNNLQKVMGKDSALIIETQHLLLKEGNLTGEIKKIINSEAVRTEWAIKQIDKKYTDLFNNIADPSFKERRNDISDVLNRLLDNLKDRTKNMETLIEDVILVADDIPPSVGANLMSKGKLLGLVMDEGGETSHTVILARALEIPTILGTGVATKQISNDEELILDALNGEITINPTKASISKIAIKKEKYELHKERLKEVIQSPNLSIDKREFNLLANIEFAFETDIVESYGGQGIGLFRTEFLFRDPAIALSEQEQYLTYKTIAQKIYPHQFTIRTFDVGRDKNYSYFEGEPETNPALGTMAVRLFFKYQDILKIQIKSILRANESGNIKILFPMITEIEEIYFLKSLIEEAKKELSDKKSLPNKKLEMGIMIEIPGTVKLIKHLKNEIDFFSIGTNDLIQYLLAVDRNNSSISHLFNPFHPAVIENLFEIHEEICKINKEVVVCGEMAGQTLTALMLLGMGYTNFSMYPMAITEIKRAFTRVHYSYLKKISARLIKFSSKSEIEEYLIESIIKKYPSLYANQPFI